MKIKNKFTKYKFQKYIYSYYKNKFDRIQKHQKTSIFIILEIDETNSIKIICNKKSLIIN